MSRRKRVTMLGGGGVIEAAGRALAVIDSAIPAPHTEIDMEIPDSVQGIVERGPHAHLTTLNRDGSPQVSVVWIGIEAGEFVMGHMGVWQKVRNVRRDPRVSLSFLGDGKNAMGLDEYVVVYGDARITEGGAADLLQRLARIYLGPDVIFPPAPYRDAPGYITRIRPDRFAGVGPWNPEQR